MIDGNIEKIIPYLTLPRADIYSEEVNKEMNQGVRIQLENIIDSSPQNKGNNIENWLDNFAFRINLNLLVFIMAGIIAFVLAILTIAYQAYKAATQNPVESLKYE